MAKKGKEQEHPVVFLGGVFLPSKHEFILKNSRGVVQNAADSLQKAFLAGFLAHTPDQVHLVNLPFIGSYPRLFKKCKYQSSRSTLYSRIPTREQGFSNVRFIRFWSRLFAAYIGLYRTVKKLSSPVVVIYSANLPFLSAALLLRAFKKDVFLCAIIPDLPEFMGVGGPMYVLAKKVETIIFRWMIHKFDSVVLLTDAMGEKLDIPKERRVVVEGIFNPDEVPRDDNVGMPNGDDGFNILYTGTLAARYGVLDLLEAFEKLQSVDAQLWICGDGDTRQYIENIASRDSRVRYLGQLPRIKTLALQNMASVLVNPRRPEGEFTKYSFPSKTMEYLASGKPVIMHDLPGVPLEYRNHLILPKEPSADGLAEALREVAGASSETLVQRGAEGQAFILNNKNPRAQVGRVLQHWGERWEKTAGKEQEKKQASL